LLFTVCARYRLPALPFLMVFAAQGIWQLGTWLRSRDFARAGSFLLLLGGAAALVHTGVDTNQVDHLRSLWIQGQVHFRTQHYDRAEQVYSALVRENPQDSDALNSLAAVYNRQGRKNAAEKTFKRSIEAAPDHARPWLNLGDFYLQQQRLTEARTALETALRHDPRPVTQGEGHYRLGHYYMFQRDFQQAYLTFKQALAIREHPGAYYGLAAACAQLHLGQEQRAALEQAVLLNPTFAPALRNLGALYVEEGNLERAEKVLRQALRYEPDSPVVHQHLGTLYLKLGQKDRAQQAFATARKLASRRGISP
jgi:tetratricopeptide (TPR) repeat protein